MTALALSRAPRRESSNAIAGTPRAVHWLAALVILAGISLPDCCISGRHLFGAGMESFGFICRANP